MEALKAKYAQATKDAMERRSKWEDQYRKDKREACRDKTESELELRAITRVDASWSMSKAEKSQKYNEFNNRSRDASWVRGTKADAREDRRVKAAAALDEEEKLLASLGDEIQRRERLGGA